MLRTAISGAVQRAVVGRKGSCGAAAVHSQAVVDAFEQCQILVRQHDYENFLWARALPTSARAPVMALRALHAETSLIGDAVAQGGAPLRQMRFRWWRDAIDSVYRGDKHPTHPVLTALRVCLDVAPPSKYRILKLLASKEADVVEHRAPENLEALEALAEGTQSTLLYLQLESVGIRSATADHAASHIGRANGLAALLRGAPHLLPRGVSHFPLDICAQHGVATEALFRGIAPRLALREVTYTVASAAHSHLEHGARVLRGAAHGEVPALARHFLTLGSVAAREYLRALQRHDFDALAPGLLRGGFSPLWYAVRLHLAMMRL